MMQSKSNLYLSALVVVVSLMCVPAMDINNGAGEIIRGLPCVKRHNQLHCPSAGNAYPGSAIDTFILDNKALMRRMYGELQETTTITTVRVVRTYNGVARYRRDIAEGTLEELLMNDIPTEDGNSTASYRERRQAEFPGNPEPSGASNKEDVCDSKLEIVTPFWASNSNGKVRAIVNNKEFEQAVHQEICSVSSTARCTRDCSCEQKYKWHRLLAYNPNNDCSGIFMDWFLFPSCCVCRCTKNPFLST